MTCPACSDTGLVFLPIPNGVGKQMYRCLCEAGKRQPEVWYFPSDRKKERPVAVPMVPNGEAQPAEPAIRRRPSGRELAAGMGEE